jgi:hypothetical protein
MERMFAIDLERAGEKGRLRRTAAGIGGVCDVLRRSFYERARYRAGSRAAADSHLASRTSTVDSMRRDVAQSMRSLRKSPGFTALTVLTLALGIGANSAIFGIVDAVLVRPLPFPDADRVVQLAWDGDGYLQRLSAAKFQYWRERSRSFDAMATWQMTSGRLEVQQRELPVQTLSVSRGFFDVLGYGPTLGRGFAPSEYAGTNAGVGLLTRRIWQAGFGGEAAVLGTTVILNGQALTIVGVLPAGVGVPYED